MADIILKDRLGNNNAYSNVKQIAVPTENGETKYFSEGERVKKTVYLDFSEGNMTVSPDEGTVFSEVNIEQPPALLPENIVEGITIAGIEGTYSGGGGTDDGAIQSKAINFHDQFGNVLYSYTRAEAAELTALPDPPQLDGFTCDGWTHTLAEVKAEKFFLDVGPCYMKDGKKTTILVFNVPSDSLTVYIRLAVHDSSSSIVKIDWGDGSTSSSTGSSSTSSYGRDIIHTYTTPGLKYVSIQRSSSSGFSGLGDTYSSPYKSCVYKQAHSTNAYHVSMDSSLISILGYVNSSGYQYEYYAPVLYMVKNACNLQFLSGGKYFFANTRGIELCPSLKVITSGCLAQSIMQYCSKLKRINLYGGIFANYANILRDTHDITDIVINCKGYGSYTSYGQIDLHPRNRNCRLILNGYNNANGILTIKDNADTTWGNGLIYVPDDKVDMYKTDASWAPVADCIRPLSEYPDF